MSADSSWMMSGAVPPANCVTSWSWTLSQLPCTRSTFTSGLAALKSSTIFLVAVCVSGRKASDWNFRVTGPESEELPDPPPPQAAREANRTVVRPAAAMRRRFMVLLSFGAGGTGGAGRRVVGLSP